MKLKGTCTNCGRELLVQQLYDSEGHCPWCGKPFQADYTAVLVDALRLMEDAGSSLESSLEKIAGMHPSFVLDEESVLARIEGLLDELSRGARRRST